MEERAMLKKTENKKEREESYTSVLPALAGARRHPGPRVDSARRAAEVFVRVKHYILMPSETF